MNTINEPPRREPASWHGRLVVELVRRGMWREDAEIRASAIVERGNRATRIGSEKVGRPTP